MTGRVEIAYDAERGLDVVFANAWSENYRERKVGGGWLLTNPAGGWTRLTDEERGQLRGAAMPMPLFRRLERTHLVLTEANTEDWWPRYRRWTEPHFRHPVHHIVVATRRCNFGCSYCHVAVVRPDAGKAFDLSDETADAILDFMLQSPQAEQGLEFQGGESLLNGETLRRTIRRARERFAEAGKTLHISVQTNASLMDDGWQAFFREHRVSAGTSLDGPKAVHDQGRTFVENSRGAQVGTYDVVRAKSERHGLAVLPTIHRGSLPAWREIVDMQLEDGGETVAFQPVYPINSAAKNWDTVGIETDEFLAVYDQVVDYLRSLWTDDHMPLERRFRLAVKKLATGRDVDFADFGNPCGMVHSQMAYDINGDIYTCDEGRDFPEFRLGNVRDAGYDEVVFGPAMQRLKGLSIPNDPECHACAYRPYCSTCPVYDRAKTGELTARHAGTDKCRNTKYIFDKLFGWCAEDPGLLDRLAARHGC